MMRVVATAQGYLGCFREVGDEFEVPVGTKGSWFTAVVESKPAGKAKRKDAESDPAGDEASEAI
jgi:hypothetical protein